MQDVGTVAREAQQLVADGISEQPAFTMTVTRLGREDSYDSPKEFEQDVTGELRLIEKIYISIRPADFGNQINVVVIFFKGRAGAWLSVEGSSEVGVSGTAIALEKVLNSGRRRARWTRPAGTALTWLGAGIAWAAIFGVGEGRKGSSNTLNHVLADVGLALLVVGLLGLVVGYVLVPSMELRRAGEPTRLQRLVWKPSRWLLSVVVVAAITAVIGVVLTKVI
jgi:hypothetical protein